MNTTEAIREDIKEDRQGIRTYDLPLVLQMNPINTSKLLIIIYYQGETISKLLWEREIVTYVFEYEGHYQASHCRER